MKLFIFYLILTFVSITFCKENVKELKKCKYGDHKCMEEYATYLLKTYPEGNKELGFPSVDPFHFNYEAAFKQNDNNPISMAITFSHGMIVGARDGKIYKLSGFEKDPTGEYEIKIKFPYLTLGGPYKATGQFLVVPLSGHGKMNITFVETHIHLKWNGERVVRNGKTYMQFKDHVNWFKMKSCHLEADNIINGNELLSNTTMQLLNDNCMSVIGDYRISVAAIEARVVQDIVVAIFDNIPYDELFVD